MSATNPCWKLSAPTLPIAAVRDDGIVQEDGPATNFISGVLHRIVHTVIVIEVDKSHPLGTTRLFVPQNLHILGASSAVQELHLQVFLSRIEREIFHLGKP